MLCRDLRLIGVFRQHDGAGAWGQIAGVGRGGIGQQLRAAAGFVEDVGDVDREADDNIAATRCTQMVSATDDFQFTARCGGGRCRGGAAIAPRDRHRAHELDVRRQGIGEGQRADQRGAGDVHAQYIVVLPDRAGRALVFRCSVFLGQDQHLRGDRRIDSATGLGAGTGGGIAVAVQRGDLDRIGVADVGQIRRRVVGVHTQLGNQVRAVGHHRAERHFQNHHPPAFRRGDLVARRGRRQEQGVGQGVARRGGERCIGDDGQVAAEHLRTVKQHLWRQQYAQVRAVTGRTSIFPRHIETELLTEQCLGRCR